MIEVQGLTKSYGSVVAVHDLSFSVAPGEVLGLVGPNGAGKTTTLRSIVGIVRPTGGAIRVGGHDVEREPVAAKRLLAFMPDEPHLFDYLTVEEHLRFTAHLHEVADVERRIPPLLQELELAEKAEALPGELSRGMKQTIKERARQGAAVVLSSHLLHLVEEICTRVLIMQRGRKVALGTIAEILTERPDLRGLSL